jgi:putative FmdB family regulatory protein
MPIFEYICKDCGQFFERIVPRHDSSTDCPKCQSVAVEKQLSTFAVAGGGTSEMAFDGGGCGRCDDAPPGMCQRMGGNA